MKQEINVFDYANEIMKALEKGILLTTKNDKVNTMVISWGMLGNEWGKPIFTVFVRENRFTKHQLDVSQEFTINIPLEKTNPQIIAVCGTQSGKDIDKVKECGLTLENSEIVDVPAIKEFPLTLECKVIYQQKQNLDSITSQNKEKYYPQNVENSFSGSNQDVHTAYYGEIVKAYIKK